MTSHVPPSRLFHYQRFDPEHLDSLLTARRIKLSRPDSFNDPWDCRLRYAIPTQDSDRERLLRWFADVHRKRCPQISEAKRALLTFEFKSNPAKLDAAILEMERGMYDAICRQYRVYCLTEKPDSQLMWSHYANSHTGICIELDATGFPFRAASKVNYQTEYPQYDMVTVNEAPLLTKSAAWEYEGEWRLVAEERAFHQSPMTVKTDEDFLELPRGVLRSIIIGMRADDATRAQVSRAVKSAAPDVLIRQAERAPDRYEVVIEPAPT